MTFNECAWCGQQADYHGLFNLDGEQICWACFKSEEIRQEMIGDNDDR